jgi:phospholipid/cholesterol/gamma-HCH transport system permease protein
MKADEQAARIVRGDGGLVNLEGAWTIDQLGGLERKINDFVWPGVAEIVCDAAAISRLDTGGAVLLQRTLSSTRLKTQQVSLRGLSPEFSELLNMVSSHWAATESEVSAGNLNLLEALGRETWNRLQHIGSGLSFIGESSVAIFELLSLPWLMRWRLFFSSLEIDGFRALPIIGLLTFLMGIVIAYQGAEQLRTVGANIFVVDLVGISLLREIAPLVTAILVAGRSGSAYAAQIGTMKVTEELDALRTLGLSPMHILVVPKFCALVIALPLLAVYADIVGVFGGMLIATSQLDVNFHEFLTRFQYAVALRHFFIGVGKAPVFAGIIALVGCYQGFQIRGGVDDVGRHTTISVVQSIFLVIVFDALFSIVLSWWKL